MKDQATNPLRLSGAETDYLKTASHFGRETLRADLKTINVGQVQTVAAPANETTDFLNNLTRAVDQKRPLKLKTIPKGPKMSQPRLKVNVEQPPQSPQLMKATLQLNQDLVDDTNKNNFIHSAE